MALIKKITKQGNSYSLILDRALIDLLGITPDTPLEITTPDGQSLHIRPMRKEDRKAAFKQALEDVIDILLSLKGEDSYAYTTQGNMPSRTLTSSCCRPPMEFA